jgi:hypothetical protein
MSSLPQAERSGGEGRERDADLVIMDINMPGDWA